MNATKMNATISITIRDLAQLLLKAKNYTKSESLQEKLELDEDLVREMLEDENYYSIELLLDLNAREQSKVLKTVSHLLHMQIDGIAFVNEFDSDGDEYAMVNLDATLNVK